MHPITLRRLAVRTLGRRAHAVAALALSGALASPATGASISNSGNAGCDGNYITWNDAQPVHNETTHMCVLSQAHTVAAATPGETVSSLWNTATVLDDSFSHSSANAASIFFTASDLMFTSDNPSVTSVSVRMNLRVAWDYDLGGGNCLAPGATLSFNVQWPGPGADGSFTTENGATRAGGFFETRPFSGEEYLTLGPATVPVNQPVNVSVSVGGYRQTTLCERPAMTSVGRSFVDVSFAEPAAGAAPAGHRGATSDTAGVFLVPAGISVNSADLGIVDNHWVGTPVCATIVQDPAAQNVVAGATASFTASAVGVDTLRYQWLKDGAPLADGGAIAGATTPMLTISPAGAPDVGAYRLVADNGCLTDTSAAAPLTIDQQTGVGPGTVAGATGAGPRFAGVASRVGAGEIAALIDAPRSVRLGLNVLSVSGARIATVAAREYAAGQARVAWNGRTAAGRAAAGAYLLQLVADGRVVDARRVILVR